MKHVFNINPQAGKGKAVRLIHDQIINYANNHKLDYEIIIASSAQESRERMQAIAEKGKRTRFYACGGDGTVFCAINALYKYPKAELAVIPLGSGNDFIRLFGTKEDFGNIDAQVNGTAIELDLIKYGDLGVAINQCSVGLDATVNANTDRVKKVPLVTGEAAYMISALMAFGGKMGEMCTVQIDDEPPFTVPILFCVIGNSRWYGGGFKAAPRALPDDGLLDFIIVEKERNRFRLFPLLNTYKKGEHINKFLGFCTFKRGKKIRVSSDHQMAVNCDGEALYTDDMTFEILENAARFVIPTTSNYIEDRKNGIIHGGYEHID